MFADHSFEEKFRAEGLGENSGTPGSSWLGKIPPPIMAATSFLLPTQRYAAEAQFALALQQAQLHQTPPLGYSVHWNPPSSLSDLKNLYEQTGDYCGRFVALNDRGLHRRD